MADRGNELEKFKRQASDLLYDLHARKLSIPAGILLVLIVAAMLVLPKSPAPPPPPQAAPAAVSASGSANVVNAANLKFISATPITSSPLTFGTADPFAVGTHTQCHVTKSSKPRQLVCVIGSTVVLYWCPVSSQLPICTGSGSSGATGASGASGGGGGATGSPGAPVGPPKPITPKTPKSSYYVVDAKYDGKTFKSLVAGDMLPTSGTPVVFYAGSDTTGKKAVFVLADGVSVQGANADPNLGSFEISAGDQVVLTTAAGDIHQLQLVKIRKITK